MQQRTLIRARGLASFRAALVALATDGAPLDARRRTVIVPTRASGELLRQTIEQRVALAGRSSVVLPDFTTRDEWIGRLHAALVLAPPLLSRIEREIILARAAREAQRHHPRASAPFDLRPGLVRTLLEFYDELKRRQRGVRRFARALFAELGGARGLDRGSDSLIRQTAFFGFAFLAYERAVRDAGVLDEHGVRSALLRQQPVLPFEHLVVAVADHPSDPRGLWPADFDLIGRLTHLARIDIVVTDEAHDAGFRERLEEELPGIAEARAADVPRAPRLVRPATVATDAALPVRVCRDREDEVRSVARAVRAEAHRAGGVLTDRVAIVFQRPLPYLYLAQQILIDARVPYQAFDALPLAAEPYAALLDLVLDVARTAGTRESSVALLRSTLLALEVEARGVGGADAAALDAVLGERRATGDASTYAAEVDAYFGGRDSKNRIDATRAGRAARAAAAAAEAVAPFRTGAAASGQIAALAVFLRAHERLPRERDTWADRHLGARAAVLAVLDELAAAFRQYDDGPRDPDTLTAAIHHALEARTFSPRRGDAGVHLVDAVAARFGDFDRVHIVGLVDTDWPERTRRNVFYTPGLLKALGWPQQVDQMRAEQAAFRDLVGLARTTTAVSAFQLEGDAIVGLSPMTELLRGLPTVDDTPVPDMAFADERLARGEIVEGLDDEPAGWLAARLARPSIEERAYSGFVDAQPASVYRVSKVDRYVDCPFKYFSETVLRLREERDEMAGLTPLERGTLLHTLFEQFYREWQDGGGGSITASTLPDALAMFSRIAEGEFERLPEADRVLERARVLGSIVGSGVAERVFELEVDAGVEVRSRLLEEPLQGLFSFPIGIGFDDRAIAISGKADRIDVLADGSLRVVDYKLGRMPDLKTSVQIAVYAHCAQQKLEEKDGEPHPVSAAAYLAFGDEMRLEGRLDRTAGAVQAAVRTRAAAFEATVARIEAGEFPPAPKQPGQCQWCGFSGVCRKEYRAEDEADETADAV